MGIGGSQQIKFQPKADEAIKFTKQRLDLKYSPQIGSQFQERIGSDKNKDKDKDKDEQKQKQKQKDKYRRIFGCMVGSIIGDALGAYCQFQKQKLKDSFLIETMKMGGGGVFNLQQGQYTDDSQLAYHLLKALTTFKVEKFLYEQTNQILITISKQYVEWLHSGPFDMGITCRKGIQVLSTLDPGKNTNENLSNILKQVGQVNNKSQSNGSLMRIAPMPIFFSLIKQNPEDYRTFIENQISLIHSNDVLRQAGYIWVKVIYDLINRQNNLPETFRQIFLKAEAISKNAQVKEWFKISKDNNKVSALQKMGWARIAWTYGMNLLYRQGTPNKDELKYYQQIKQVIRQGGDSDTNAAIVGGLLGAIIGFQKLPFYYLKKLFSLQFQLPLNKQKPNDRPGYQPLNFLKELLIFIKKCRLSPLISKKPIKSSL